MLTKEILWKNGVRKNGTRVNNNIRLDSQTRFRSGTKRMTHSFDHRDIIRGVKSHGGYVAEIFRLHTSVSETF